MEGKSGASKRKTDSLEKGIYIYIDPILSIFVGSRGNSSSMNLYQSCCS
jgi:hypothetical protein